MDINNNQWGANYGDSYDTINIHEFMNIFDQAVEDGEIIIVGFNGDIPLSTEPIGDFVYDESEQYSGN